MSRFMKFNFSKLISLQSESMCLDFFFFFTTLNIYKDYFKGHQKLHKCEAKLCSYKLWSEIEFFLVHLSFEEIAVFVHLKVLWPRSFMIFFVWWNEELCNQHLSQVGDQIAYWDPHIYWLVTYWELCIENERLSLQSKSN